MKQFPCSDSYSYLYLRLLDPLLLWFVNWMPGWTWSRWFVFCRRRWPTRICSTYEVPWSGEGIFGWHKFYPANEELRGMHEFLQCFPWRSPDAYRSGRRRSFGSSTGFPWLFGELDFASEPQQRILWDWRARNCTFRFAPCDPVQSRKGGEGLEEGLSDPDSKLSSPRKLYIYIDIDSKLSY